jgi:adenine-specific DNA-methyltransferase
MPNTSINPTTLDLTQSNITALKALFPEAFVSGKCDMDTLADLIGEETEDKTERYGLIWHGKQSAKRIIAQATTSTLDPVRSDSINWDTTGNALIEGDNLEVLKILQKSYKSKVKMIYIDPPYNTGKDFVYADNFNDNLQNYLSYTGQLDEDGRKLSSNPESDGRYHDKWLSMMYPRLKLARNLLRDDGVIFISIDDHEVQNLRYLCDEIFGVDNFIGQIIWEKMYTTKNDSKLFSDCHEYVLCYAKSIETQPIGLLPRTKEADDRYSNPDNDPRGNWKAIPLYAKEERKNGRFPIVSPKTQKVFELAQQKHWIYSEENIKQMIEENRIWFGKDGNSMPNIKRFLTEVQQGLKPKTLWTHSDVGSNDSAKRDLRELFGDSLPFDFPKPTGLIEKCVQLSNDKSGLILDFFAGSGTTAQAVMELNAKDGGNRKYICVQLPEPIVEGKSEQKEAYEYCIEHGLDLNIASLTKERIRKAGAKVARDNPLIVDTLDLGFRVFRLSDTHFNKWNSNIANVEELKQAMNDYITPLQYAHTDELLYETLLKEGLDLALNPVVETVVVNGFDLSSYENGEVLVCVQKDMTIELFEHIIKMKKLPTKVICLETGLPTDMIRVNAHHILDREGIILKTM